MKDHPKTSRPITLSTSVIRFLISEVLLAAVMVYTCTAATTPDPIALLQGVEAARLQIPPSHLRIRYTYKNQLVTNTREFEVDFDGDRHLFVTDPKTGSDDRTVFDGSVVYAFEGDNKNVDIRNLTNPNLALLFDPRLLGLNPCYFWHYRIETVLPYRRPSAKVELVGRESVGDKEAWHVRVSVNPSKGYVADIWIDDRTGFPVYRYDMSRVETLSFYENKNYPWLPSRVEGRVYDSKHELIKEYDCSILDGKANVKLPDGTWSLGGLHLPTGTSVQDLRISKRLGYWNGTGISPSPDDLPTPSPARYWVVLVVLTIIAPGVLLLRLIYRRQKGHSE
jgi:hypothetical protein